MKKLYHLIIGALISFTLSAYSVENAYFSRNQLSKMQVVAGLQRKSDGSFCMVDVRGQPKLTPSYVKTASQSSALPKEVFFEECNTKQQRQFKQTANTTYLKGDPAKKVVLGSALSSIAKASGLGCVVGSGIVFTAHFLSQLLKDDKKESSTQAKAPCIDCQKNQNEDAKKAKAIIGALGATGAGGGFSAAYTNTQDKKTLSNKMHGHLKTMAIEVETKGILTDTKSPNDIRTQIAQATKKLKSAKEAPVLVGTNHIKRLQQKIVMWNKVLDVRMSKEPLHRANSQIRQIVNHHVRSQVATLSPEKLLNTIPPKRLRAYNRNFVKKQEGKIPGRTMSGFLGGILSFIVCENGTTYLLEKKQTEI